MKWIANENGIIASGPQRVPADLAGTYDLLRALGVVEESVYPPGHYLTHGGHLLIQRMLELGEH